MRLWGPPVGQRFHSSRLLVRPLRGWAVGDPVCVFPPTSPRPPGGQAASRWGSGTHQWGRLQCMFWAGMGRRTVVRACLSLGLGRASGLLGARR